MQGCFSLSARYAVCFNMGGGSKDVEPMDPNIEYPTVWHYEEIGEMFEKALNEMADENNIISLGNISSSGGLRKELVNKVKSSFTELGSSKSLQHGIKSAINALTNFVYLGIDRREIMRQ